MLYKTLFRQFKKVEFLQVHALRELVGLMRVVLIISMGFSVYGFSGDRLYGSQYEHAGTTRYTNAVVAEAPKVLHTEAATVSSPVFYQPQSFDVLHYDVHLDLRESPTLRTTGSRCVISFRWVSQPDTFRFHLRGLTIDSVAFMEGAGSSLKYVPTRALPYGTDSLSTYHHTVPALSYHKVGDTVQLAITYSGMMTEEQRKVGLVWGGVSKDGANAAYSLGVGFSCNYVSCTQHWMPCYDLPSDKATFSAEFVCDPKYNVLSNGILTSTSNYESTLKLYRWEMASQCATNLLTFAVGPYVKTDFGVSSQAKPIVVYSKSSDTSGVRVTFRHVRDMVDALESLYGPFPFEKIGYVVTPRGSMEHQTLISFSRDEFASKDTLNEHVAHELAHQWFGDLVTPYDYRDAWIAESFATYSEPLWYESYFGKSRYLSNVKQKGNMYLTTYARLGGPNYEGMLPVYDFSRVPPSSNFPQTIYVKGACVLAMLRYMVGDSAFFSSVRDLLSTSYQKNASYDSVVNAFHRHTPAFLRDSVSNFFKEWIKGRGWPVLDIQTTKMYIDGRWQAQVNINQVQVDSLGLYTWFPLELSFKDEAGTLQHRVVIINGKKVGLVLDSLNNYTSVQLNSGTQVHSLFVLTKTPSITSVESASISSEGFSLYPNPSGELISIGVPKDGRWKVQVFDQVGRLALEPPLQISSAHTLKLDLLSLTNGSYTISLQCIDSEQELSTPSLIRCTIAR